MPQTLIQKMSRVSTLSRAEIELINRLPSHLAEIRPKQDVVLDLQRPTDVNLILQGFCYRYKLLEDGRRQVMAFLIPGDFCDLRAFLFGRMDHSVATLDRCQIAAIPHSTLREAVGQHPSSAAAFWKVAMLDGAIYREWLVNVGRRTAYARIAHLLCEVWFRLQMVGKAHDHSYEFPVTQADLGDATGLSVVHVNRTLQVLRMERLITLRSNVVTVLDWPRLQAAGQFDPSYLTISPTQE